MNSTTNRTHSENEQYEYYPLDTNAGYALLAEDHEIVVNPQTGQVTLVNWERRHFVTDCLFTVQECTVLMALLDAWSSYMPTDQLLRELRKQAGPTHEQQEPSGQDMPLTRLRTVFARCQERLHHLGLRPIALDGDSGNAAGVVDQLNFSWARLSNFTVKHTERAQHSAVVRHNGRRPRGTHSGSQDQILEVREMRVREHVRNENRLP